MGIGRVVLKLERHRRGCDDARWMLGDWAVGVVGGGDTLANVAASVGVERRTLERCYSVAKTYPAADRLAVSWKHHQVLVFYSGDEDIKSRAEWLAEAAARGWGWQEMLQAIKRYNKPLRIHYRAVEESDRPFCGNLSSARFSEAWGEVSCLMCLRMGGKEKYQISRAEVNND